MKKSIMRKAAWAMAGALMFTSVLGSSIVSQAAPKTKKIVMNKKKVTLKVGKTFKLKVKKVNPAKSSKAVTYKSNKTKIATVSKKGVIKAKKVGKAKITVVSKKNKKAKATVSVVVKKADAKPKVPAVTAVPAVSATPGVSAAPGTTPSVTQAPGTSATPESSSKPGASATPPRTQTPKPPKTATPSPTPKYEEPEETAPPTNFVDLTSDDSYHNESPEGATVVKNEDGSLTVTFTQQWAALNFYLPDNAQIYYSAYKSVALTYTSRGGNLGHALYDVDTIVGGSQAGDGEVGKHPDWGQKVVETAEESTLIFPVTSECAGGCIRGLQIFNPNATTADNPIEITIKAIVFSVKENPSLDDLKPPVKPEPNDNVTIESAPTEMAVSETSDITVAVKEGTIESVKWEVEGDAVTIAKDDEIKTVLTAAKAGEAKVSVTVTVKIGDKTETSTKTVTIQVNNPAKKE